MIPDLNFHWSRCRGTGAAAGGPEGRIAVRRSVNSRSGECSAPACPLALLAILLGAALPAFSAEPQPLPWEREISLREAARSVVMKNTLNPTNPLPDWSCYPKGQAMTINNLKMRTTLWGTPDRVTISLMKNNVWDRRINTRGLTAPTLQEIVEGALDPANKDYEGVAHDCQRPKGYGYLLKGGGFYDPYREPLEYPMPCQKPVGQIILGMDAFAGAPAPQATQSCANGVVSLSKPRGTPKSACNTSWA
jgi:hypothetical protein